MANTTSTQSSTGFLSFNARPPRIWLTSPSAHPPEKTLLAWKDEGFEVSYLPYTPQEQASYMRTLKTLGQDLQLGETYALLCYGAAATVVLKTATKPLPRCCAIVAFYPTVLPSPKTKYPSQLQVQVHVAGVSHQVSPPPPPPDEWFADPIAGQYAEVEAGLAWTRALGCVRRGFQMDVDIEPVVQAAWTAKYEDDVPERGSVGVVKKMTQNSPHVTILPTLEGGVGRKKLEEFYCEFFIPSLVEDFDIRLISRTIGVDRIVDEMVVSFIHSDEVDWILPGVQATGKNVRIAMVSIVAVRGGKLVSEHMYWDQASVLVQVGLLDPKVIPQKLKKQGLKRLPVVGAEAAEQLINPRQEKYNGLLKDHGLLD
ncbi:dienelactone hydrolase-like protein [Massariosphaeria phaeospora]|uniref:Dienelactone hydrolase-like protein n=1 Tax=Massariosphaeria phaeospora TaxID=100035 RepID=A0A7C8IKP2_9PLEO|nr:dienelactone hydrolase-like protein [Massariosphaeria phaeospora]